VQQLQRPHDVLVVAEEVERFVDLHRQHLRDVLAAVLDAQRLAVVAPAAAGLADHPDVGEEVHLDLQLALALAGAAAALGDVEREAARA
jgi:hypothetical protein